MQDSAAWMRFDVTTFERPSPFMDLGAFLRQGLFLASLVCTRALRPYCTDPMRGQAHLWTYVRF